MLFKSIMTPLTSHKQTLIIRYHRIGDALIGLYVVRVLSMHYPNQHFWVLTHPLFIHLQPLIPNNITLLPMPVRAQTGFLRGVKHLVKRWFFAKKMRKTAKQMDQIAYFQLDSFEKKLKSYTSKHLPHVQQYVADIHSLFNPHRLQNKCADDVSILEIYRKLLHQMGYSIQYSSLDEDHNYLKDYPLPPFLSHTKKLIAIAPFTREYTKLYPLDKMEQVIAHYAQRSDLHLLILGGGQREAQIALEWERRYSNVISLIGKVNFCAEIGIISHCRALVAMDSFNMHLSIFLGVPTVSVWGATTPNCGYYPSNYTRGYVVVKNIDCQPCSFFGENPCSNVKEKHCMDIPPHVIIEKIDHLLKS